MSAVDLIEELVHRASEHPNKLTAGELAFVRDIEPFLFTEEHAPNPAEVDTVKEILEKLRLPASQYRRRREVEDPPRARW